MPDGAQQIRRQIIWPSPLSAARAEGLLRRFAAERIQVTFEARVSLGQVSHYFLTPLNSVHKVSRTIETLTGATTVQLDDQIPELDTTARLTRGPASLPLVDEVVFASRQLLTAMSSAHFREERLLLRISLLDAVAGGYSDRDHPDPTQSVSSLLLHGVRSAGSEMLTGIRRKAEEPSFRMQVTAGASAASETRRRALLEGLLAALKTNEGPSVRLDFRRSHDSRERPPKRGAVTFSPRELLAIVGWPLEDENLPGMPPAHPRQLPLRAATYDTTRVFATTTAPGPERPIGLSIESGTGHLHVIGPTRSGKSTMVEHLIATSIQAGYSIFVIDAKTDLAVNTMRMTPRDRWDDVVVIDPAAEGPVVSINPFDSPGTPPEVVADSVLEILHGLWPDAFGPRTSHATLSALLTLAGSPGATLAMLPQLFDDRRLRERLLKGASTELRDFWDSYEALSDGAKQQMVGPVRSRLSQYLMRPQLHRALQQPSARFHLNDLYTEPGRIVVVPLNSGLMGEASSRLAGSLLVSQLLQLALARMRLPAEKRRPVMIVIDEFQAFVHSSGDQLEDALSRVRAAGVGIVLCHQYRAQVPRDLMAAIDANCLSKVVFRLQSDDARAVAAMAPDLTAADFMSLPRYGIYASMMHDGEPLGWVSGRTLPPPDYVSDADDVRRHSLERWGNHGEPQTTPPASNEPRIGRRQRGEL